MTTFFWFILLFAITTFIFQSFLIIRWYKTDDFVRDQLMQPNYAILWVAFLLILSSSYLIPKL